MNNKDSPFAPFEVRSFRFQWPSDLLTSLAFEMETLILGWYVFVETRSVVLLAVFGSLQYLGTLIAPMFGVMGDRVERRTMLCAMRAYYSVLAIAMMALGIGELLNPAFVFAIAVLSGLVRPSDLIMRMALIGDTMPGDRLMKALGLARMTMDSARIFGALAGASLFSLLGIGYSYIFVAAFYAASFCLTLGVSRGRVSDGSVSAAGDSGHRLAQAGAGAAAAAHPPPAFPRNSGWRDLKDGLAYVWNTPKVLAIMWLAFLTNFAAYPLSNGLLPYVAKQIYRIDALGLSYLAAAFGAGALAGSILMTVTGGPRHTTRIMLVSLLLWYASINVFASLEMQAAGIALLFVAGFFQSTAMISMAVAILTTVTERFRARVMGVRMLAVYGLPVGLLLAGIMIDSFGFAAALTAYCAAGVAITILIAYQWRDSIWR